MSAQRPASHVSRCIGWSVKFFESENEAAFTNGFKVSHFLFLPESAHLFQHHHYVWNFSEPACSNCQKLKSTRCLRRSCLTWLFVISAALMYSGPCPAYSQRYCEIPLWPPNEETMIHASELLWFKLHKKAKKVYMYHLVSPNYHSCRRLIGLLLSLGRYRQFCSVM